MTRFFLLIVSLLVACSVSTGDACAQQQESADSTIALPTQWDTYYVVLLKEGSTDVRERSSDSLQVLMNHHIQYQLRLQQSGQAVASGGFGQAKDGFIGMSLLKAASLEEAECLAQADPAVKAGRFSAVVYAWHVPSGRLP